MITGTPASVHELNGYVEADRVHRVMRERAAAHPEWAEISDGIVVRRHDDGTYVYGFDPAHPGFERAKTLEFGTSEERPASILRAVLAGERDNMRGVMKAETAGVRNA